jgi:phosphonate transport system substrate-binding protein
MRAHTFFVVLATVFLCGCSDENRAFVHAQGYVSRSDCEDGGFSPEKIRFGIAGYWGGMGKPESFSPFADTLSKAVGIPVEVKLFDSYEPLVRALQNQDLEMALLPPLAYVQASAKMPCLRPLRSIVVLGHVMYRGYIMVRDDSEIAQAKDLKGKRLALVERWSSSGYLFPMTWLMSSNIHPTKDLASIILTNSHQECIKAVLDGRADACGTFEGAIEKARRDGFPTGRLRVLGVTGRIPNDAVVVHPKVSRAVKESIDRAMERLNTTTPEGRLALAPLMDITGFAVTDDQFYDPIRVVLKKMSLLGLDVQ